MRQILLGLLAILALSALLVGGVSAHEGESSDDRMDEMMDRCLELMNQLEGMMDDGMMNDDHGMSDSTSNDDDGHDHGDRRMGC